MDLEKSANASTKMNHQEDSDTVIKVLAGTEGIEVNALADLKRSNFLDSRMTSLRAR